MMTENSETPNVVETPEAQSDVVVPMAVEPLMGLAEGTPVPPLTASEPVSFTWQPKAVSMYGKGSSIAAISKKLAQAPKNVRAFLLEKGIQLREPRWWRDALGLYRQEVSVAEIATRVGRKVALVRNALKLLGEITDAPKAKKRKKAKAEKKHWGVSPETMKAIVEMYAKGSTLRQVGAKYHLTAEGVRQVLMRAQKEGFTVEVRTRKAAGALTRKNNPPEPRFCPICGDPILHKASKTCSVKCAAKYRTKGPPQWVLYGIELLKQGHSFSEAANIALAKFPAPETKPRKTSRPPSKKDPNSRSMSPWILSRWASRRGVDIPNWKIDCKDCGKTFEFERTCKNKPLYCPTCRPKDRRKFIPATHFAPDEVRIGCEVTHRPYRRLVKTDDPTKVTCQRCLQSDIFQAATAPKAETGTAQA